MVAQGVAADTGSVGLTSRTPLPHPIALTITAEARARCIVLVADTVLRALPASRAEDAAIQRREGIPAEAVWQDLRGSYADSLPGAQLPIGTVGARGIAVEATEVLVAHALSVDVARPVARAVAISGALSAAI